MFVCLFVLEFELIKKANFTMLEIGVVLGASHWDKYNLKDGNIFEYVCTVHQNATQPHY